MKKKLQTVRDSSLSSYLSYVYKIKLLTEDEEKKLSLEWKNNKNQQAAQKLMISHLPLVVKVAYSFKNYGQPLSDLISEGSIGLMRAIYKFEPNKGFRLATYAVWWIKAYITEYILNSWSLVKSGSILGRKKLFFSLRRIKNKLGINTANIPEEKVIEISNNLNVSKEDVNYVNNMIENKDVYIDAPMFHDNTDSKATHADFIVDHTSNPEQYVLEKQNTNNIKSIASNIMNMLSTREQLIMKKRFLDDNPMSLSAIGEELKISRERVRQIEKKALEKAKKYISNVDRSIID